MDDLESMDAHVFASKPGGDVFIGQGEDAVQFTKHATGGAVIGIGNAYLDEERLIALLKLVGIDTGSLVKQTINGVVTFDAEAERVEKAVKKAVEAMQP